jgi:RNA-directed DNA polymerase
MQFPPIPKPRPELIRKIEDSVGLFLGSKTLQDVANTLEVHPGHLRRWLYSSPGHAGYTHFQIPKKTGGFRRISSPPASISILQDKFKTILDRVYRPKDCVCGFVIGRSIVYGASRHKKHARWILNVDLKDFYPSINFGRVIGLFTAIGIGPKAAAIWAHLVTVGGQLPQGAPTSPVVSNMIAKQLDNRMIQLAARYHLKYTRYADDLSLSTTKHVFPKELVSVSGTGLVSENLALQPSFLAAIQNSGFSINPKKTRLYSKAVRQEITGLTVNEFVNVRRSFVRQIRGMIHGARRFGLAAAGTEYIRKYAPQGRVSPTMLQDDFDASGYFLQVVYGKLAFLRMVRGVSDKCYASLCLEMAALDPKPPKQIMEVKSMYQQFEVFVCHASEDKVAVVEPLYQAMVALGVKTFVDDKYIKWGDSFIEKINHALSLAQIVLVVLSINSVDKAWPKKEINAVLAREIEGKTKILPLMVGSEAVIGEIIKKLPLIADKKYETWKGDAASVAKEIKSLLGP